MEVTGTCFRCGALGHFADSAICPWLIKAVTRKDHEARIASLLQRFFDLDITPHQKREYIRFENKQYYGGKVPSQLA